MSNPEKRSKDRDQKVICQDDIANWFLRIFLADAVLPGIVPGFVVAERAAEECAAPYGVFTTEISSESTYNSGYQEWKLFTLTATVYGDQDTVADSSAIQQRMNFAYPETPSDNALRNSGEIVFTMIPVAASSKFEPKLRNANDVVLNRFAWKITAVGNTYVE